MHTVWGGNEELQPPWEILTFDVPEAFLFTYASGINNAGKIVGWFSDANGKDHGFLRTAAGSCTRLDVPGAIATRIHSNNDAGQIVGDFSDGQTARGFLHSPTDGFTTLDIAGADAPTPHGINDAGQVVGTFFDAGQVRPGAFLRKGDRVHAFLRSAEGAVTLLDVPDVFHTEARGINTTLGRS